MSRLRAIVRFHGHPLDNLLCAGGTPDCDRGTVDPAAIPESDGPDGEYPDPGERTEQIERR